MAIFRESFQKKMDEYYTKNPGVIQVQLVLISNITKYFN